MTASAPPTAVGLDPEPTSRPELDAIARRAAGSPGDPGAAFAAAPDVGSLAPQPGAGSTRTRWEVLATLGAVDLTWARALEAHLDALSILREADAEVPDGSTWGVYAAEGPGVRLDATAPDAPGGRWRLTGTKPWCSLAGTVSHALVTANVGDGRRLFAVHLADRRGVTVRDAPWVSRGLVAVPSGPVDFEDVAAVPVGASGWYLDRPGFAWGGIGVAACWYGGAVGVARRLWSASSAREPDQVALMHLGAVDLVLTAARACLAEAAAAVDTGAVQGADGARLAARVRGVVAAAAEQVLERAGHGWGPAPLTLDEDHARRVADLTVYLRQHHAERDEAALGSALLQGHRPW